MIQNPNAAAPNYKVISVGAAIEWAAASNTASARGRAHLGRPSTAAKLTEGENNINSRHSGRAQAVWLAKSRWLSLLDVAHVPAISRAINGLENKVIHK